MTQTLEPTFCLPPARSRALPLAPVLIRVPAIKGASFGGVRAPVRRRRLRREIRVAGFWLLALIPPSVACATWGGTRSIPHLAINSPDGAAPADSLSVESLQREITLSLEPAFLVPAADPTEGSVILSGELLPADAFEETAHGGY